jgi:ubiquinone/menaquinone biosynthesis C-methylase UbiE
VREAAPPGHSVARHLESLYASGEEPWAFSERGVEVLRHERLVALTCSLRPRRVLDVGCSLGQLTWRLAAHGFAVTAVDVSPSAVARAGGAVRGAPPAARPEFVGGSALALPFEAEAFDLVLASDGLRSWQLAPADRRAAVEEMRRVVRRGGHVIFTEHLRPEGFGAFVDELRASPLAVDRVLLFHDRPCYQFEGLLKRVRHTAIGRRLRRSTRIARVLCALGRVVGPRASRHVCVIAVRGR